MNIAIIGAGKWGIIMERFLSKAQKTTLTLCRLQQSAHATSCIKGVKL